MKFFSAYEAYQFLNKLLIPFYNFLFLGSALFYFIFVYTVINALF